MQALSANLVSLPSPSYVVSCTSKHFDLLMKVVISLYKKNLEIFLEISSTPNIEFYKLCRFQYSDGRTPHNFSKVSPSLSRKETGIY